MAKRKTIKGQTTTCVYNKTPWKSFKCLCTKTLCKCF